MAETLFYSHFYCWQKYKSQEVEKDTKGDEKEMKDNTNLLYNFPFHSFSSTKDI